MLCFSSPGCTAPGWLGPNTTIADATASERILLGNRIFALLLGCYCRVVTAGSMADAEEWACSPPLCRRDRGLGPAAPDGSAASALGPHLEDRANPVKERRVSPRLASSEGSS